jgi:putative ABC transport system permease protein
MNLKTFYRTLTKNPLFTFINLMGLSIGLAASILVYLWVEDEVSFDRFHENHDRIFRIERDMFIEAQYSKIPITAPPLAPQMARDYPQVEAYVRLAYDDVLAEDVNTALNKERLFYADTAFFSVFSFRVLQGDPATCLSQPTSIALSQKAAAKYLNEGEGIGSIIRITLNQRQWLFTVTAIFEDFPANSHFRADLIASFISLYSIKPEMQMQSWMASFHYSYIMLKEGADYRQLQLQIQEMVDKYHGEDIRTLLNAQNPREILQLRLAPLTSIHLDSNRTWELEPPGSRASVSVFSLVAVLLLVIAGINFMNLSTARASKRAREVGIRKVAGASRSQLVIQFLTESLLFSFVALLIALVFVELVLPWFSGFTDKEFSLADLLRARNIVLLIVAWFLTSLLAGIYPAFFLSSYQPAEVLKGKPGRHGGQNFRKILVVGQFVVSTALIICAITAYRHLQFINHKNLGYDRADLLEIPMEDRSMFSSYSAFKNEILEMPGIINMTRSMVIPTGHFFSDQPFVAGDNTELHFPVINFADENYIPTLGLNLVAGSNFTGDMIKDSMAYYLINESALQMFGFQSAHDALGTSLGIAGDREGNVWNRGPIVGVVQDFHYQALTEKIRPMVICGRNTWHNHIIIRTEKGKTDQAQKHIEEVLKRFFPQMTFTINNVDSNFHHQHQTEHRLQILLLMFTILSVFIASLGLLGLSAFSAEQRLKEIGIRKTLGASVFQIIALISASFSKLVLIAGAIALPLAWYVMNDWLNNFPYRRGLEVWIFATAIVAAWIISMITVLFNAWHAAGTNPVKTLKYE